MADEVIKNDDIEFGNGNIDPTTGEPYVVTSNIIADDQLSDDQRTHLTQFAPDIDGASFNDKGDIVGSDGKVVMSKADLDVKLADDPGGDPQETEEEKAARLAREAEDEADLGAKASKLIVDSDGQPITIGDVEYTIKDGVAVDADGNIKLDKEALQKVIEESIAEGDESDDYIEELSSLTGFKPVDDKGNDIEYENSIDGIAKYISDTVRQEGGRIYQEEQDAFFTNHPQMKDAYNYLRVNKSLEGYGNVTNHAEVTLDKSNTEQLSAMIVEGEMLRGRTKEQALRMVGYAKDDNRLFEEATDNLTFVKGKEAAEATAREAAVAAMDKADSDAAIKYWDGIKSTIDAGTLEGYIIPENIQTRDDKNIVTTKSREDFYNYVSQTVDKDGNSAAALARAERGAELELLIDYVMFTGGDLKSLVNLQVKKEKAKDAKLKFGRNANTNKVVIGKPNNKKVDNNDIK